MHPKTSKHAYFFFFFACLDFLVFLQLLPKHSLADLRLQQLHRSGKSRKEGLEEGREKGGEERRSLWLPGSTTWSRCSWRAGKSLRILERRLSQKLPSLREKVQQQVPWEFGMVWSHSGKPCSSLLSFRAPPWIISALHVLKGPGHLGGADRQSQAPAWRKERSERPCVGSFLASTPGTACSVQAAHSWQILEPALSGL